MYWRISHKFSKAGCRIADTHYNRQKVGSPQFVPPGSSIVLLGRNNDALWVSLKQEFVDHAWPGYWANTLFKNESLELSSDLIIAAVSITRQTWGTDTKGIITFIDRSKVRKKKRLRAMLQKSWMEDFRRNQS